MAAEEAAAQRAAVHGEAAMAGGEPDWRVWEGIAADYDRNWSEACVFTAVDEGDHTCLDEVWHAFVNTTGYSAVGYFQRKLTKTFRFGSG